jgi:hypothetical protein
MTNQEIKLMLKIIDNLRIFTSDEGYVEMLDWETDKENNPNFESDMKALEVRLGEMQNE